MAHVGNGDLAVGDAGGERADLVVRPLQELVEEAELAKDLERRGMNGISAEITEEIGMLLEHLHGAAGEGEEQARHDSGRTAASDDEIEF
jgi:hypothetical protein